MTLRSSNHTYKFRSGNGSSLQEFVKRLFVSSPLLVLGQACRNLKEQIDQEFFLGLFLYSTESGHVNEEWLKVCHTAISAELFSPLQIAVVRIVANIFSSAVTHFARVAFANEALIENVKIKVACEGVGNV